jgi:capsular polysaccharide biosynthesis protein
MDVARYLDIGRRWWWLLILGAMFSIAAYGVVTRLHLRTPAPPTYAASTTLFATLPPPPEAQLAADPSRRPWELDRLIATYAEIAKSRTVAERAVLDAGLAMSPDELAARVETDTFGYTQLLRITVTGTSSAEADRSAAAIALAFSEVRAERALPGDAVVYETSPAVRMDHPTPEIVNIAIVAIAGLASAAGLVLAFEYLRGGSAAAATGFAESKTEAGAPGVRLSGSEGA